jgi:uncharacterized membrane protein YkoI
MKRIVSIAAAVIVACGLSAAPAAASPQTARCFDNWSEAALIVGREALTSAKTVHEAARERRMGDLVRITLCQEAGRYVYRLVLHVPAGRVVNMTVDARTPFDR